MHTLDLDLEWAKYFGTCVIALSCDLLVSHVSQTFSP